MSVSSGRQPPIGKAHLSDQRLLLFLWLLKAKAQGCKQLRAQRLRVESLLAELALSAQQVNGFEDDGL